MLFLVAAVVAALAVYVYVTDPGDEGDYPPYKPFQPPRRDEQQSGQSTDPSQRRVDAPVEVDTESPTSLRLKANLEGDLMNRYFQQSKQAYERGDHAGSKAFKAQGKRHEFTMKNLHAKASASIYQEHNRGRPACEVDLHGLYVKEAIAYSDKAIEEACGRRDPEIRLIVGKGGHSDGGVSKLKPAIQRHLRTAGIPVEVDSRNPGVLIVQVVRR